MSKGKSRQKRRAEWERFQAQHRAVCSQARKLGLRLGAQEQVNALLRQEREEMRKQRDELLKVETSVERDVREPMRIATQVVVDYLQLRHAPTATMMGVADRVYSDLRKFWSADKAKR